MLLDTIHGIIDRRILLNYRIDPAVLRKVLPAPFEPKLYDGYGIGGVCMIRFKELRPRHTPAWFGIGSENAAHRIAVQWMQDGERKEGVFIPQRNTNSWFNKTLGGRVFPGIFSRSQFMAAENGTTVSLKIIRPDGGAEVTFTGHQCESLPKSSIFTTLDNAAGFFSLGATGYSATHTPGHYHGMELHSLDWTISPLAIESATSCFFDNRTQFPSGSIEPDCALLMRGINHEWHSRPDLYLSRDTLQLTQNRALRRPNVA